MNIIHSARTILAAAAVLAVAGGATVASAALPVGATAPDFQLQGALAGKPLTFSLHEALSKGPVVLYFFPAAFTKGCTIEAHEFAEATDDFKKLGATVIGVTAGNVDRVAEFSSLECRDKFAVAADPDAKVATEYQNIIQADGRVISDRTSYVIAPGGKILLSFTDKNPDTHIEKAMEAVKAYAKTAK
ncbi:MULTISPECIES: peroxiredoxin [Nitrospirillum]|uniref:thioredoxin-dependent peroxiredoxin n=1 Tax=Nitrospirillum amazonense TaxID=28077 RepID=A0A560H0B2_9PROT|nr:MULTISPECIES: peroxiredoxin [Nitrospirillum]MDZ5649822.1 peroxiredoxin [Nitrospirillum sp. BR 11828]MEE3623933.1 peroxiredoxin [Nitrospirillum sp. BR 11752]TWB39080.1 peroxiredoxin [Nitrospirillum amazonense]